MTCPKCGGETWDNGPSKAQGRVKPNAPDFACKNKEGCGWKQWPPKTKGSLGPAPQPLTERPKQLAEPTGNLMPWESNPKDERARLLFWVCFDDVLAGLRDRKLTDMFNGENLAALTATLYIQRSKVGA